MLIRISLIFAIVAALAVGALNILQVRTKIDTLITQRNNYHTDLNRTTAQLADTRQKLSKTESDLGQTQLALTNTMTQLAKSQAMEQAQFKRANDLADRLKKADQDLNDAQTKLQAYIATGYTPKQILTLSHDLKSREAELAAVKEENQVLYRTKLRLQNQLALLIGTNFVVTLPAALKGKVIAVDPKWDFVILNIGGDQGVLDDGEMLVSRDGKLVAKVIVRSVQKDRSIANIMPGWQLGPVIEGDVVTPAHPAT